MRLSIGGVLADAAALWRAERDVLTRVAGVFFLLPILALAMLATTLPLSEKATPDEVRAVVSAFYAANLVWLLLISLLLDFGSLVLLNLFLRGPETLGAKLAAAATRLLPFVLIGFANGAMINLGFWLLVVPGLYIFGRTWLMGPAYAANPQAGLLGGVEQGFRMSHGNGWRIALLGIGTALIVGSAGFVLLIVMQAIAVLAGGAAWVQAIALVPVATAGAAGYIAFTLVRVAVYRRLAGSISGT